MWTKIAGLILRNRIPILSVVLISTIAMVFVAQKAQMSYSLVQMLPEDDSIFLEHVHFQETFGEEANLFAIGIEDKDFFEMSHFKAWRQLVSELKTIDGVKSVTSTTELVMLQKDTALKNFKVVPIFPEHVQSQAKLDSLSQLLKSLPIYKGLIYNDSLHIYVMTVSIDKERLNTEERVHIIEQIHERAELFSQSQNNKLYYSGLPYIRTEVSKKVKKELSMFIGLAGLVVLIILFILFRNYKAVAVAISLVSISVVWTFATVVLFDFEITILTGMLPPLLIVIGVPNSIFMINKYLQEYSMHGNKIKALQRTIKKTGSAIFMTNLTTAAGFGTFIITNSDILVEFGIVASINVMGVFVFSLLIIPTVYSLMPPPRVHHHKHLDNSIIDNMIDQLINITESHRNLLYVITVMVVALGIYGISRIQSTGYIVDDLPKDDPIYTDLKFFEKSFGGLMPFEIVIDTKKEKGALKLSTLKKVDQLQKDLKIHPELSEPISMSNGVKFARQSFFNNRTSQYKLPSEQERNFVFSYLARSKTEKNNFLSSFIDSTERIIRISYKVQDIGTLPMQKLHAEVQNTVDSLFPKDQFYTYVTGTSVVYTKGTSYLMKNLFSSLAFAIVLISLFMALMFRSWRMVLISLIPNMIPQIITAGLMGYFDIPLKPSTILIFSIAFGISVDDTIHFLSKYRQELKLYNWDIGKSVHAAIKEVGTSMFYTSVVLFFGFSIFIWSDFGGTVALGLLISITLFFAMITNLVVLPSLLLTLEKLITTKAFKEPLLSIFDEEEDIELEHLALDAKEEDIK